MSGRGDEKDEVRVDGALIERLVKRWPLWLALVWTATSALLLYMNWDAIRWFVLRDTDDNMRMMQVRALIEGQGWYDLRQYRLDPPGGADIHWSRLVDLPIAGIKLALAPLIGGADAEKAAVAIAPLLPMAVTMTAMAVTARRLLAPAAFALAVAILLCADSTRSMWAPMRIDHHGWQLAMLSLAAMALTDPRRARGGAVLGIATAISLTIGLEMLLYLALAGGLTALMWVREPGESRRLSVYGISLGGGCAAGYLLFASYASRAPVCDALSPVWLSAVVAAGALGVLLSFATPGETRTRLALGGVAAAVLAAAFAAAWPQCLGRLEGVSPDAQALWLDFVREARPIYKHGLNTAIAIATLPLIGLAGYGAMLWRVRREPEMLVRWGALASLAALAAALLLWQSRAGPAAQLLAVPGATGLGWLLFGKLKDRLSLMGIAWVVAVFLVISGILPQQAAQLIPRENSPGNRAVNRANGRCPSLPALRPIALLPKGTVLTFVDLGPRLITVTPHDAVAGPYHRNDEDIADVMKAFRGTPEEAHGTVLRRDIDYVLICPGMSESTIYAAQAKNGFYMQLVRGKVPAWLQPVALPKDSPYRIWRVVTPRS